MNQEAIIGTWRLVSFHARNDKGEQRLALGENAQGLLVYTADRYMIANLSAANRPPFRSPDFRGGTPEEALMAVNSFISYSGRYAISGDTITHHVEMSVYPNWTGHDQVRNFRFEENRLVLSTPPFLLSGAQWTFELVWERV